MALLQRMWTYAITTKADYAREYADEIAEAASKGYCTTIVAAYPDKHRGTLEGVFGRLWKVTPDGLAYLWANGDMIAKQEEAGYEAHCID